MSHPAVQRQLREANRARLREAALHEFALHGQHGAKVSEIVARAGLTQPCFYRVWSSKEEAFSSLMNDLGQIAPQMARAFLDLPPHVPLSGGVLNVTRQHFRYLVEQADITRLVVRHLLADQAWRTALFTTYEDVFTELQRRGQLDTDLPPHTAAHLYFAISNHWFTRWWDAPQRDADAVSLEIAALFRRLLHAAGPEVHPLNGGQFPTAPSPGRSRHEPHPTHRP